MIPRFGAGAFWLFATAFVGTVLLGDASFGPSLRFDAAGVGAMDTWWQVLSGPFVFGEAALYGVGLTMVTQWIFGSRLDALWGTRRFVVFALACGVTAYAATAALARFAPDLIPLSPSPTGMTPIDVATLVAFVVAYWGRSLELPGATTPIPAVAAAGICALPVLGSMVFGPGGVASLVPAGVAALVALVFVQPWKRSRKTGKVGRKKVKNKAGLRLVRSPDDLLN